MQRMDRVKHLVQMCGNSEFYEVPYIYVILSEPLLPDPCDREEACNKQCFLMDLGFTSAYIVSPIGQEIRMGYIV